MSRLIVLLVCLLMLSPTVALTAPAAGKQPQTTSQKRALKTVKPARSGPRAHAIQAAKRPTPAKKGGVGKALTPMDGSSRIGYLLMDIHSGQILEAQHDSEQFIPASVSKVPSTLAALHILGADHRFVTSVHGSGPVVNGVLQGDLILVGGGDPSLTMAGLMDLANQMQSRGIYRVAGRFLYDESAIIPQPNISDEQNEEETYNQGVSALSLDPNRVRLKWMITRTGQIQTQTTPNLDHVTLVAGPSSGTGPTLVYLGGETKERWQLNPRGARSGWDWVPIKRPGHHTAMAFREFCRQSGLHLPEPEPGRSPPNALILANRSSEPLSELARFALEHSNNLWTELIGIMAASRLSGKPQTTASAAKILSQWIHQQLPQVDWNGFHLANSSGLSSVSRITPRQMAAILLLANAAPIGDRAYAALLPVSGWKGTLASRFAGPDTAFRVWAKTGTVLYGKALAGYLYTKQNRRLVFAVFASDFEKRKAFDAKMGQHASGEISRGRSWNGQATGHINALVERWLRSY
ncbi:MAG: D-alanyl-D-alanine carboxypeptidase/D-alanyl-D-alanine-endopeptidase [Magnetococcales bacterium]|nr:D-alanyl-D-alanine carboxypeptidase/D-alanyl-D-alanine-endopeptidase [Magnetococcales bacterium]